MTSMKTLSLAILLAAAVSCTTLPPETEDGPPLSEHAAAHKAFQESEKYASTIYIREPLLEQLGPANMRILITLEARRAQVLLGDEVVIDTPVSPGKRSHPTPTGDFSIIGKRREHRSNLYGSIYDAEGNWQASGDQRTAEIPEGGKFVGTKMPYWMRLTNTGVGMHVGPVPSYAASHGCIRLPNKIGKTIFEKAKVGTPVAIVR
jgi:lipoprotein-anchoring transpeptidase ErfK/SrfK